MVWYEVEVTRVVQETPRDRTFVFRVPPAHAERFRFRPGQYVTVTDVVQGKSVRRSYSISSSPNQSGTFDITVRDAGTFGDHFFHFEPGKRLQAMAPRGGFLLEDEPGRELVLTAGGSGVTPYRCYARYLAETSRRDPVTIVHSVREPADLIFREEFEALAKKHAWFRYVPTVTRLPEDASWSGRRGRIDADLIRSLVRDPSKALLYACGPNEFVDCVAGVAAEVGIPETRFRREKWG
jgi:ferredoxin-NADP reductase